MTGFDELSDLCVVLVGLRASGLDSCSAWLFFDLSEVIKWRDAGGTVTTPTDWQDALSAKSNTHQTGDSDLRRAFAQFDRQLIGTNEDVFARSVAYVRANANQIEFEQKGVNVTAIKQFEQVVGTENHLDVLEASSITLSAQSRLGGSSLGVSDRLRSDGRRGFVVFCRISI